MNGPETQQNKNDSQSPYDFDSLVAIANYHPSDPSIKDTIDEYGDPVEYYSDDEHEVQTKHSDEEHSEEDPTSWQSECFETIKKSNNVILSSPTGSGKTRVFLEWARDKKEQAESAGQKHTVYITAPIKALSNQRFREMKKQGLNVGLETGDIKNVPEGADYICCTQEIYTNKYRNDDEATLIMDEFHYIFEDHRRARTYIDSLHQSRAQNILLASATFGDTQQFHEYVDRVSSRHFLNYENKKRITTLEYKGEIAPEAIRDSLVVTFSKNNCRDIAYSIWSQRENEQRKEEQEEMSIEKRLGLLAYRTSMKDSISFAEDTVPPSPNLQQNIDEIAQKMKIDANDLIDYCKRGVAYYYGSMLPKEKLFVETLFEKRLIDTVVGTDALALGVNFPVQKVVFTQLAKYYDGPISKNLFEQLSGRAGRKGYFDKGEVYYCDFGVENYDYDTAELFQEILESDNESAKVSLTPNIKDILLGKATVESEVDFITQFSTAPISKDSVSANIIYTLEEVERFRKNQLFTEDDIDSSVLQKISVPTRLERMKSVYDYGLITDISVPALLEWVKSFYNAGTPQDMRQYLSNHPQLRYIDSYLSENPFLSAGVAKIYLRHNENVPTSEDLSKMANSALSRLAEIAKLPPDMENWERYKNVNPELFEVTQSVYDSGLYYNNNGSTEIYYKSYDGQVSTTIPAFVYNLILKLMPDIDHTQEWLSTDIGRGLNDYVQRLLAIRIASHFNLSKPLTHSFGDVKHCLQRTNMTLPDIMSDISSTEFMDELASRILNNTELGNQIVKEVETFDLLPFSDRLTQLVNQEKAIYDEFGSDMSNVYFDELSAEENCSLFKAVLRGHSEEEIMDGFTDGSFSKLLQLRKYFRQLPKKYRKNIKLHRLDQAINSIDDTALRSERTNTKGFTSVN